MTILELLEGQAKKQPEGTALIRFTETGVQETRRDELADRVRRVAAGLRAIGIRDGDRVAIVMPNSVELLVTGLGVMAAGGVDVSMDPMHPGFVARHVFDETSFRYKVVADDVLLGWTEYAGIMDVERVIHHTPLTRIVPRPTMSLAELTAAGSDKKTPLPDIDPAVVSRSPGIQKRCLPADRTGPGTRALNGRVRFHRSETEASHPPRPGTGCRVSGPRSWPHRYP